jgi:TetR/AcrR family transcriptional regulator
MLTSANSGAAANRDAKVREFKRSLILDGARAVFAEKGLEGASIRAIAAAAGCTTGAVYPYFSGKEEIYAELLSESLDKLKAEIEAAASGDARSRLCRTAGAFFTYYRERPGDLELGLYLFQGLRPRGLGRELDRRLNDQLAEALAVIRAPLAELAGDEERADIELAALFTWLTGLLIVEHTRRIRVVEATADPLLEHYLEGLLARLEGKT